MDNYKNQADEICENLFILIQNGIETIETADEDTYEKITSFVESASSLKTKEHPSLTSKTLFKFMDLIECC